MFPKHRIHYVRRACTELHTRRRCKVAFCVAWFHQNLPEALRHKTVGGTGNHSTTSTSFPKTRPLTLKITTLLPVFQVGNTLDFFLSSLRISV